MRSWINALRSARRALPLALLLVLAPAAWAATEVEGVGLLELKDLAAMTLTVDDVLLQITDDTDIFDAAGQRMSFASIPNPGKGGTMEVSYQGTRGTRAVTATRLRVRPAPQ